MRKLIAILICAIASCTQASPLMIGYFHNWTGKSTEYIRLRNVPSVYNQINVAFAIPDPKGSGSMTFVPKYQTPEEFRRDIEFLQARGTRVLLSIGGGNHPVVLNTRSQAMAFSRSLISLLNQYGFNGIDINLEKHSFVLDSGDIDFRHPTTPRVVNFIQAIKTIVSQYDNSFVLSASPETQFLTAGHKRYGGEFGGYLPVLHALRDQLDVVHMQYYNSGTQLVYDGIKSNEKGLIVTKGTPDFVVALTEMLVLGFPVAQKEKMYFPGLGAKKVAIGLPATPSAASGGGYLKPAQLQAAMHYLMTGKPTYKTTYRLRQKTGHPDLAGIMTWSINWDASRDGETKPYAFAYEVVRLWNQQFR
jgi:chitinase